MKKLRVVVALLFFVCMVMSATISSAALTDNMQQPVALTDIELDTVVAGNFGGFSIQDMLSFLDMPNLQSLLGLGLGLGIEVDGVAINTVFGNQVVGDSNVSGNVAVANVQDISGTITSSGIFQNISPINSTVYANISINVFLGSFNW